MTPRVKSRLNYKVVMGQLSWTSVTSATRKKRREVKDEEKASSFELINGARFEQVTVYCSVAINKIKLQVHIWMLNLPNNNLKGL